MKIYSLLALFGFFLGAVASEIAPDQTAQVDDASAPVPVEETATPQEGEASRTARGRRRNRRENNSDSDDDTNDPESDESDL